MNEAASTIPALEERLKAAPFDAVALSALGWAYMQSGRYIDAVTIFGRAISEDPAPEDYANQIYARTQVALQILDGKPPNGP